MRTNQKTQHHATSRRRLIHDGLHDSIIRSELFFILYGCDPLTINNIPIGWIASYRVDSSDFSRLLASQCIQKSNTASIAEGCVLVGTYLSSNGKNNEYAIRASSRLIAVAR